MPSKPVPSFSSKAAPSPAATSGSFSLREFASWVVAIDQAHVALSRLTGVGYTSPPYVIDAMNLLYDAPERDDGRLLAVARNFFPEAR
jgi:hypothetical protein